MEPRKRRQCSLDLTDPVFDAFTQFAATAYPEQPLVFAVREACLAYVGTDPLEAARVAARRAAWIVTRIQVLRAVKHILGQVADALQTDLDTAVVELRAEFAAEDAAARSNAA